VLQNRWRSATQAPLRWTPWIAGAATGGWSCAKAAAPDKKTNVPKAEILIIETRPLDL
jgi:hypothetical protein